MSSTWQACSNCMRRVLETTLTSRYTAPPAGTAMQETCSYLDLLDALRNPPVSVSLKFWIPKRRWNLGMGRRVKKKRCFCACFYWWWWPALLLLLKMPRDRRLGTSALLYLLLYTFTIIMHSLLSPSRNTHMWAHTLKTKNMELSPLRKNEANFIPSLKHE